MVGAGDDLDAATESVALSAARFRVDDASADSGYAETGR